MLLLKKIFAGTYAKVAAAVCIGAGVYFTSISDFKSGAFVCMLLSIVAVVIGLFRMLRRRSDLIMNMYCPWVLKLWGKLPFLGQILRRPQILFTLDAIILANIIAYLPSIPYAAFTGGDVAAKIGYFTAGPGDVILVILVILVASMLDYRILGYIIRYEKTEYAQQTKRDWRQVINDKGLWAEFLAYVLLDLNLKEKRFLFNPIIPHAEGDGFTELDLVCITQDTITVVEAKNRGGQMAGQILDYNWTQQIGKQTNSMENPFLQNQNHIIALHNYLVHGDCAQRLEQQPTTLSSIYHYHYRNVIFLADPTSWIEPQGALAENMHVLYTDDFSSYANSLSNTTHTQEMDAIADYLLPNATSIKLQDREFLFQFRETLHQMRELPDKTCYYIITVRDNLRNTQRDLLLRYNSLGVSQWTEEGFWGPPASGVEVMGPWNPMIETTTSFAQAKSRYDALRGR